MVCAGAGGHAGTLSPFALVREVKQWFKGTILLSGAMSPEDRKSYRAAGFDEFIAKPVAFQALAAALEAGAAQTRLAAYPERYTFKGQRFAATQAAAAK